MPLMVIAYAAIHHRCGDKEIIGISGTWERSHVHTILITCHFSSVHEFGTKHTGFFSLEWKSCRNLEPNQLNPISIVSVFSFPPFISAIKLHKIPRRWQMVGEFL